MPGAAVMSKLDSSSTRTMWGSRAAGWQSCAAAGKAGAVPGAAASMKPCVAYSTVAITPERMKFETWLFPWNGSNGCSGTASESADTTARHTAAPTSDVRRRTVYESIRQTHASSRRITSAASGSSSRNCGNVSVRKRSVSGSTITKSKKLSVAQVTLILNHDRIRTAPTRRSDSAAATPGRRNSASQAKLDNPQTNPNSTTWNGPRSVRQRTRKAAACRLTMTAARKWSDATVVCRLGRRSASREVIDMGARSEVLDQPGIDEKTIEAACLGAAAAEIECAAAAAQDLLLLVEGRIERQPGRLLDDQRQVG